MTEKDISLWDRLSPKPRWITVEAAAELIGVPAEAVADWASYGLIDHSYTDSGWLIAECFSCCVISRVHAEEFAASFERFKARRKERMRRKDRQPWEPEPWREGIPWMASELGISVADAHTVVRLGRKNAFLARKQIRTGKWYVDRDWVRDLADRYRAYTGRRTAGTVLKWLAEERRAVDALKTPPYQG